jgi:hypothetical protein
MPNSILALVNWRFEITAEDIVAACVLVILMGAIWGAGPNDSAALSGRGSLLVFGSSARAPIFDALPPHKFAAGYP